MQKKSQAANSKSSRQGDTSRTSSQGRKISSGGNPAKRGDPAIDENTKSPLPKRPKTAGKPAGRS